ncbi:ABC transporter permease [Demequina salsinemoris]|uniref:ABC transporter permease n=1 Tax=Demequina salsinemoris TaxID=577470 RepID=UPI0007808AB3|nr:ABC transporter permease [Demequina salsinemoris]
MLFSRKRALARAEAGAVGTLRDGFWDALGKAEKASLIGVGVVIVVSLLGPVVWPYSAIIPSGEQLLPPLSGGHILGTDTLGMDMMARLLSGMQRSLMAAVVVTTIAAIFGSFIGVMAGFRGGAVDTVLMRVTDLFLAFPATIIAMAVAAALGQSIWSAMAGITVVWWPLYARLVRGEVRRVVALPHVQAAKVSGVTGWRLLVKHVTPAVTPTIAVTASLDIGAVIMTLAGLSFIGLGTPAPAPELGRMASDGMKYFLNAWWISVLPSLAIGLLSFLFNYAGDALRVGLRRKGV